MHDGFSYIRGSVMNKFDDHKCSFVNPLSKNQPVSTPRRNVYYLTNENCKDENFNFRNTQPILLGNNEQVHQPKKVSIPLNPLLSKFYPLITF